MRIVFAAFAFAVALSGSSDAGELSSNSDAAGESKMTPKECVLAATGDKSHKKSWQECFGLPPGTSITAGMLDPSKEFLPKPKFFTWHGPWSKSSVDYLLRQ